MLRRCGIRYLSSIGASYRGLHDSWSIIWQ